MMLTWHMKLNHLTKEQHACLTELTHTAKNLKNQAYYNIKNHYKETKKYLSYNQNDKLLKSSDNYKLLNSNMSQQILRQADEDFKGFFELLKKFNKHELTDKPQEPHYLPKEGFTTLIIQQIQINDDGFLIPFSRPYKKTHTEIRVKIPPPLKDKVIKEVRIKPISDAKYFEIHFTFEMDVLERNLDQQKAIAIDLGVDNLMTVVSSDGDSFIIDGKKLKSLNQWYNKRTAQLRRIKSFQHIKGTTKQLTTLSDKRKRQIHYYIYKACRIVFDYCIEHNIGIIVVGYNTNFQQKCNLGKVNNQNFAFIPFGQILDRLSDLCMLNNLCFFQQEESYTSKASFWDKDEIPVYDKDNQTKYEFSGKRIHRGVYQTSDGTKINADVNGALNILRKSNVVSLDTLYARGEVKTPRRILIA